MYKCDLNVGQTATNECFDDLVELNESKIGTLLIFRTKKLIEEVPICPHQIYKFRFPRPITNLNR